MSRRRRGRGSGRVLLGLSATFVALLGLIWLVRSAAPPEAPPEVSAPGTPTLEGVTVDGLLEGRRQWTLHVRSLEEAAEQVELKEIGRGVFFRSGTPWLTLSASRGRWAPATNDLELEGSVAIDLIEGGRLETERVRWEGEEGVLVADTGVTATLAGDRLTASHMAASAVTGIVELGGGVEVVRPDGQRLRAQGARWLDRQQRLELVGELEWFFPSPPRPAGGTQGGGSAPPGPHLHEEAKS